MMYELILVKFDGTQTQFEIDFDDWPDFDAEYDHHIDTIQTAVRRALDEIAEVALA